MTMLRVRTVLSGWPGGPGLNTFYFAYDAPVLPGPAAVDVVARVRAFWFASASLFPNLFTAQVQANVDDLDETTGALVGSYAGGAPAAVVGTLTPAWNAFATALLLRENTGQVLRGRRVVGRSFIGPVGSGIDAAGVPGTPSLTTMINAATTMFTGTTFAEMVVWSRPTPTAPGSAHAISNFTAAPFFAVLRSRRD